MSDLRIYTLEVHLLELKKCTITWACVTWLSELIAKSAGLKFPNQSLQTQSVSWGVCWQPSGSGPWQDSLLSNVVTETYDALFLLTSLLPLISIIHQSQFPLDRCLIQLLWPKIVMWVQMKMYSWLVGRGCFMATQHPKDVLFQLLQHRLYFKYMVCFLEEILYTQNSHH